jgi:HEPN domain-containing protein
VEIDIRKDLEFQADIIRYAEKGVLQVCQTGNFVTTSDHLDAPNVEIYTKKDAEHLIKALEKAISLGWWK